MDGKTDTVREALIKLRDFAKSFDCDYQEECTPGDDDMCQSCKHVCIADGALADLAALSAIDPEAKIKRIEELETELESARKDRRIAWDDANKAEAALKAIDPGAIRREMLLRDALDRMYTMVSEPDFPTVPNKYYHHVLNANRVLSAEPAQDDGKPEVATFEEMEGWLISKSGQYKSEYIQASIVMLRNMFEERSAEVKRRIEEAKE